MTNVCASDIGWRRIGSVTDVPTSGFRNFVAIHVMIGTGSNRASIEWTVRAAGTTSGVHIHFGAKPMKWSGTQIALAPSMLATVTPALVIHSGCRHPS